MLAAIDIGNTDITIGLFDGPALGPRWRLASDHDRMADEYGIMIVHLLRHAGVEPGSIENAVLASVVPPLTGTIVQSCRDYLGCDPLVIDAGVKTGVKILYEDPKQVGADRIVDAAAVHHLYGGPACIVDFGTATAFDAISASGEYVGGAIAPGMRVAAESLFRCAAKLPKVDLQRPPSVIGKNTVQSMQSGLVFGYVAMVEGMVVRFRAKLGPKMKVVGTGALIDLIARETDVIGIIAPWLTLDGLRIIHEMNRS